MTTEEFKRLEAIEARKLLRWRRFAELIRGGFDPLDAFVLSTDPEIDVRQAVDLPGTWLSPKNSASHPRLT